jgi:hypothetical protein
MGDRARHVRAGIEARLCAAVRRSVGAGCGEHRDASLFGNMAGNAELFEGGMLLPDGAALAELVGQLVEAWLAGDVIKDEGNAERVREREALARAACEQVLPWASR